MAYTEILEDVKKGLGITGTYQDDTIQEANFTSFLWSFNNSSALSLFT